MRWNWTAIGAIGTMLGGLAAVAAILLSKPVVPSPLQPATSYYVDGCEQRIRAINLRAAERSGHGAASLDLQAPAGCVNVRLASWKRILTPQPCAASVIGFRR